MSVFSDVKMHDTWRETLCHCALLVASLKSVRIVVFNQPDKRGRPPLEHMLIFLVYIRLSVSSLYDSFPLFLTGNAPMHPQSDKLPHPPPPTRYLKTLHTDYLYYYNLEIPDGRLVIVGAQRVQERSSRSRVRITL